MKKAFYLSTCSTCKHILKEVELPKNVELQDIKTNKISPEELDKMKDLSGSYESLFSRRAMKYKSMGLKDKSLGENDYRDLILEEYTFLKRPVVVLDEQIFVGSSKKTVEKLKEAFA
ncbi:MAG: ArsC/Spx/MgsR family protein [Vicingaceae bacterium]